MSSQKRASPESLQALRKNIDSRLEVSGTGSVSWVSKDKNLAAPGVLLVSWPDKMRLEVQDPIGGTLALLVIRGGSFWWFASEQKEILTGKLAKIHEAVSLPFSGNDLIRAFLGRPDLSVLNGGELSLHSARLKKADREEEVEWSDRLNEPLKWKQLFPGGQQMEVQYEEYQTRFGASYPGRVRLENIQKDRSEMALSWVWSDWQPKVSGPEKLFQIPQEQHFGRKIKTLP